VYALACILVECLTGWPPFPADRPLLVLEAHRTTPPPLLAEATGLPPELDRVLQTALSKRPEHRQQSATGLMRAVQRALGRERPAIPVLRPEAPRKAAARPADTPVRPRPTATPAEQGGTSRSAPRRRPVPTRGAAGAAALLVVSAAAGFAAATLRPGASTSPTAPPGPAASALADPAAGQRAAVVGAVDRTIDHLDVTRAQARQDLRTARHPRAQAAAAAQLAAVYRDARRALPPPAALAAAAPARDLDATLAGIGRAYQRLADAARAGDPVAFGAAARAVQAGERQLDGVLRQVAAQA
jgi:hypothetical protein